MALFFECMQSCAQKVLDTGRHCQRGDLTPVTRPRWKSRMEFPTPRTFLGKCVGLRFPRFRSLTCSPEIRLGCGFSFERVVLTRLNSPHNLSMCFRAVQICLAGERPHIMRKRRATSFSVPLPMRVSWLKPQSGRNLVEVRQVAKNPQGRRIREMVGPLIRF